MPAESRRAAAQIHLGPSLVPVLVSELHSGSVGNFDFFIWLPLPRQPLLRIVPPCLGAARQAQPTLQGSAEPTAAPRISHVLLSTRGIPALAA